MSYRVLGSWFLMVVVGLVPVTGFVTESDATSAVARPLYIIFDGSNSMWGELPDKSRKIDAAKTVFKKLDPALFRGREVALRLYGHRRKGDCKDTELAVPLSSADSVVSEMAKKIANVSPRGKTPISLSLNEALKDFSGKAGDILLISDGIETCGADPCDLAAIMERSGHRYQNPRRRPWFDKTVAQRDAMYRRCIRHTVS